MRRGIVKGSPNAHRRPPVPTWIEPMKARLAARLPKPQDRWAFEFKWDGIRALCFYDGKNLRIRSRNAVSLRSRRFVMHPAVGWTALAVTITW